MNTGCIARVFKLKSKKKKRDDLNSVHVALADNTENTFCIKNLKAQVKQSPFYVCVICN